ncbi:hypothetical protein JL720_9111 [Aureococcus anophagefferens]|nr:hypothetical protein JL720_9111 [Aureococcus anophagefferens]
MEDVENTSPKSAKSGDGAPKREKGWSAINKVNKELEKKRENEKLQARVVEISGAMDGLRQQLWELELVNAEAAARVEELEDAATARDAKSSEAEDQLLDAGAAEVAAAVADERARGRRAQAADSNWRATQLEAELKTLRETKDATKKRLSVLDAQTQQARLAAEESRRAVRDAATSAPSDDLARTLAALLDVDAPRGDRAACGPALPAALARRLAAAARATFGRREARTAL